MVQKMNKIYVKLDDKEKVRYEGTVKELHVLESFVSPSWIKGNYTAGNVLFDSARSQVITHLDDGIAPPSNKDLLKSLCDISDIIVNKVYINKSKTSYYYEGLFKDVKWVDKQSNIVMLGFSVANTFTRRFKPYINLACYYPNFDLTILTDYDILETRESEVLIKDSYDESVSLLRMITMMEGRSIQTHHMIDAFGYAQGSCPKRIISYLRTLDFSAFNKYESTDPLMHLFIMSTICKYWSLTSYEQARKHYKDYFHLLTRGF